MVKANEPLSLGLTIALSICMYIVLATVLFSVIYRLNYPFGGTWLVIILPFIGVAVIWKLYSDEQHGYRKHKIKS